MTAISVRPALPTLRPPAGSTARCGTSTRPISRSIPDLDRNRFRGPPATWPSCGRSSPPPPRSSIAGGVGIGCGANGPRRTDGSGRAQCRSDVMPAGRPTVRSRPRGPSRPAGAPAARSPPRIRFPDADPAVPPRQGDLLRRSSARSDRCAAEHLRPGTLTASLHGGAGRAPSGQAEKPAARTYREARPSDDPPATNHEGRTRPVR
jgi:hypothetical protein